jgi:hypothetical protein
MNQHGVRAQKLIKIKIPHTHTPPLLCTRFPHKFRTKKQQKIEKKKGRWKVVGGGFWKLFPQCMIFCKTVL